ncbi:hypothetical protein [Microvirga guangxiensis]|uniref:Uncharacterized protein n=1 Tax=Microvirga guangxiensis TaxID=549386 RepID=A0A1G5L0C1_9HYPH|nr:hypothetical protein [Microvirga guangxiensis]SCZ06403.1 hypothetical protein SAMN02927923_03800 [Microvirga guangxiensis]
MFLRVDKLQVDLPAPKRQGVCVRFWHEAGESGASDIVGQADLHTATPKGSV